MTWQVAFYDGFVVFILGGVINAILSGLLTPAAWHLVRRLDVANH